MTKEIPDSKLQNEAARPGGSSCVANWSFWGLWSSVGAWSLGWEFFHCPVSRKANQSLPRKHGLRRPDGKSELRQDDRVNALTGLRAKVGNYARRHRRAERRALARTPPDHSITVLDLPGTYSLSPNRSTNRFHADVLFNRLADVPSLIWWSSWWTLQISTNLYYATQVSSWGYPAIVALNIHGCGGRKRPSPGPGKVVARIGCSGDAAGSQPGQGVEACAGKIIRATRDLAGQSAGPHSDPDDFLAQRLDALAPAGYTASPEHPIPRQLSWSR